MIPRSVIAAFAIALAVAGVAAAQTSELGTIDFPTSGSKEAQTHFIRGVLALHNFWYEEGAEAFQEAQKVDPNFAMAYWGEAMTYNHPLWREQDIATARKTLARLGASRKARADRAPTPREKAYLEAVEILYGDGDKLARDIAYSAAMDRLVEQYPDDMEAAAFYALSLLGTVRDGDKGFRRQMRSAAVLEPIFRKNLQHPGAAHYLIHSYDDPDHAPLGLPAARRYSEIASAAHHARHMPSHIFVQLGMWDDVARSNESSYAASDAWVKRKSLSITRRDYHSLAWLQYAYLQQGRYAKAKELIALMKQVTQETGEANMKRTLASIEARYVIETGQWDAMTQPAEAPPPDRYNTGSAVLLASGISAAKTGDFAAADKAAASLKALKEQNEANGRSYEAKSISVMEKEVRALISLGKDRIDEAIQLMTEATSIEAGMDPPSGPADPMKPSNELFGEILLQLNKPKEAAEQFAASLVRMPNRAASLLGSARAAATLGEKQTAHKRYTELLKIWRQADANLPVLKEAQAFSAQGGGF